MLCKHKCTIGTCLNTEGAKNTSQYIYFISVNNLLMIIVLACVDMYALRRTHCSTKAASYTLFHPCLRISYKGVETT